MIENSPTVRVQINIDLSAAALQAVVSTSKQIAGADASGHYRVDTADALSALISKFLHEKGFEEYSRNPDNY
ncbi:MAG: hypothetical protein CSA23_06635 [Deltaproteobacteria bacterium]|nr:MAG: hypothetical protein CSA23_06635 [Deltaproteobacteria bacterium]